VSPRPPRTPTDQLPPIRIAPPLCAVFRRTLRGEGLKYTAERAAILDAALATTGPFSAEELVDAARKVRAGASKATVYRTLRLLQGAGILRRSPRPDGKVLYQLAPGAADDAPAAVTFLDASGHDATGNANDHSHDQPPLLSDPDAKLLAKLCQQLCARHGLRHRGHALQIFVSHE
jgi:Fe2+ or Zn2+ uptake regulation protein